MQERKLSIRSILVSPVLLAAAAAVPAVAQTAPAPVPAASAAITAGAKVSDTQGGAVGTVASVDGDFVVLKTDRHEVRLPTSSFTKVDDGFIIAMTQAQVNAAVEQSQASVGDVVTVGAMVHDTSGGMVGTIDATDAQFATVKLAGGSLVKLPVTAFGKGISGPVIGMSAAELQAQVAAAAPAEGTAAEPTAPEETAPDEQ